MDGAGTTATDALLRAAHPAPHESLVGVASWAGRPAPSPAPASRPPRRWTARLLLLDAVLCSLAVVASAALRWHGAALQGARPYAGTAAVFLPAWLVALSLAGAYDPRTLGDGANEYRRVITAAVWLLASAGFASFITNADLARSLVGATILLSLLLTLVGRLGSRIVLRARVARGHALHRVVVAGSTDEVADLIRHARRDPRAGFSIVAACVPRVALHTRSIEGTVPVLGSLDEIIDVAVRVGADTVAVAGSSWLDALNLRRLAWQLEGSGRQLAVAASMSEVISPRLSLRCLGGRPMLFVREPEFTGARRAVKAAVDRFLALIIGLALAPLLVGIAAAVRLTSEGPALFRQTRVGQNGRTFTMLKFRTMRDRAERAEVLHLNEVGGPLFKIRRDPRVTRVGRWLRRFSLDELPQLWNVLTGSMSLVGPRPPLPSEVTEYGADAHRRLLVKPGLTGLWQVSGRSDLSWEETVNLDLNYVDNWSVGLDAAILARTIGAVVHGRGAY